MAFMSLAPTRARASSQSSRLVKHASTPPRQGTWQRTVLEAAGTFLILAGIAVGILMLRFALVLVHGVIH
jgi:hypothetical protein